jgi:hypothetical protein
MAGKVLDLFLVYQFVKRLSTPWNKTEAFKLGLIDEKGVKLKSAVSSEEQKAYAYYDRLVFNLKRLLEKLPGGKTRLGSFAAALFLMKEGVNEKEYTQTELAEGLYKEMTMLDESTTKKLNELMEDAPANATGGAVVGTGDNQATWKLDGRKKEMKAFLKRFITAQAKRKKIKERKDFFKALGL